ncbi:MAG TPA: lytic transglycosylase domain-containing protein [Candidatus Acidoferrum sp.]|nr:lytic transglycosylase domain-containing protein [Candidatus Acidoferrum sp.]
MRLTRTALALAFFFAMSPVLRAEYVNLRSGQRLHVTGYQLVGETYRLQLASGVVQLPASDVVSIEPEDQFAPLPAAAAQPLPFGEIVKEAASRYNVDADLITSVIAAESNFDPNAVSRRNARGLMQLLPETAARFGVQNIFDPKENVDAGTHYLRDLLQRYNNDLALALAAYNAGPETVQKFGDIPPYTETVSYVRRVKRTYDKKKSAGLKSPRAPANAQPSAPQKVRMGNGALRSTAQQPTKQVDSDLHAPASQ